MHKTYNFKIKILFFKFFSEEGFAPRQNTPYWVGETTPSPTHVRLMLPPGLWLLDSIYCSLHPTFNNWRRATLNPCRYDSLVSYQLIIVKV